MNILIFEDNEADIENLKKCIKSLFKLLDMDYTIKICN